MNTDLSAGRYSQRLLCVDTELPWYGQRALSLGSDFVKAYP